MFSFVPGDMGDFEFFRHVFFLLFIIYEFVLFGCPSVSLKWMSSVIFLCCRTVMSCRTLCHSELFVDRHFLKFHGSFLFCSFFSKLLVVRHWFCLYSLYYLLCTNSLILDKPFNCPINHGEARPTKTEEGRGGRCQESQES